MQLVLPVCMGFIICLIVSCFMEHTFLNTVLIHLQENVYFVGSIFYVTLRKSYFKYGSRLTVCLIKCFTQGCFIYTQKESMKGLSILEINVCMYCIGA